MASPLCPQKASQLQPIQMWQMATVSAQTFRVTSDLSIFLRVSTLQVLLLCLILALLTVFFFWGLSTWLFRSVYLFVLCILGSAMLLLFMQWCLCSAVGFLALQGAIIDLGLAVSLRLCQCSSETCSARLFPGFCC